MRILAIETSSMLGGLAVMDSSSGLMAESRLNVRSTHSETLLAETHRMLESTGTRPADLGAIAVSIGPGGFTGLRIGLGTAKGLAFATGIGIIAVPTLEAYAMSLPFTKWPVCPMLDARRREVYAGLFDTSDGSPRIVIPPSAAPAGRIIEAMSTYEKVIFAGQGALIYKEIITSLMGDRALFAPEEFMHPSPAAVGGLGLRMALEGRFSEPKGLGPLYLRKSEAEVQAEAKAERGQDKAGQCPQ